MRKGRLSLGAAALTAALAMGIGGISAAHAVENGDVVDENTVLIEEVVDDTSTPTEDASETPAEIVEEQEQIPLVEEVPQETETTKPGNPNPGNPGNGPPADLICQESGNGWQAKIDYNGNDETVEVSAPDGFLIAEYCVKAGPGFVLVPVDPPAKTVDIDHPDKDSVSHYQIRLVEEPKEEEPVIEFSVVPYGDCLESEVPQFFGGFEVSNDVTSTEDIEALFKVINLDDDSVVYESGATIVPGDSVEISRSVGENINGYEFRLYVNGELADSFEGGTLCWPEEEVELSPTFPLVSGFCEGNSASILFVPTGDPVEGEENVFENFYSFITTDIDLATFIATTTVTPKDGFTLAPPFEDGIQYTLNEDGTVTLVQDFSDLLEECGDTVDFVDASGQFDLVACIVVDGDSYESGSTTGIAVQATGGNSIESTRSIEVNLFVIDENGVADFTGSGQMVEPGETFDIAFAIEFVPGTVLQLVIDGVVVEEVVLDEDFCGGFEEPAQPTFKVTSQCLPSGGALVTIVGTNPTDDTISVRAGVAEVEGYVVEFEVPTGDSVAKTLTLPNGLNDGKVTLLVGDADAPIGGQPFAVSTDCPPPVKDDPKQDTPKKDTPKKDEKLAMTGASDFIGGAAALALALVAGGIALTFGRRSSLQ